MTGRLKFSIFQQTRLESLPNALPSATVMVDICAMSAPATNELTVLPFLLTVDEPVRMTQYTSSILATSSNASSSWAYISVDRAFMAFMCSILTMATWPFFSTTTSVMIKNLLYGRQGGRLVPPGPPGSEMLSFVYLHSSSRSTMRASPIPPPMHMVARPRVASRLIIS